MSYVSDISLRGAIALLAVILALLTAGTWTIVHWTTERLIHDDARADAREWAHYLAANVTDLRQIAAGELPTAASTAFLDGTRKSSQVFRYVIFNRQGYSQFVADRDQIASVGLSEYSPEAARAAETGQTVVDILAGQGPDRPDYFARAYVPVVVDGEPIGVVAAFVDETDQRVRFRNTFLIAALSLCGLTAMAFGLPAIAWYRRTREKQKIDRRMRYLAHHDPLTGLTNRARLMERLEILLDRLPPSGLQLAVHFIDLDRFKDINDSLGHDGGDFLLKMFGQRLRAITRAEDIVARLGGDEFVVVQSPVTSRDAVESLADRIVATLTEPMHFKQQEVAATVTVGVALLPADGNTADAALKSADLALYAGKAAGRNCVRFFAPEMDDALQARLKLERIIRHAVATGGFELHYQPVFVLSGRQLAGYEALVRLRTEEGELIPPDQFIPLAENMRQIDKIGAWVLREACRAAVDWPKSMAVAVNLSPSQFESGTIKDVVAGALADSGLDAPRLELEITEALLLGNTERVLQQLHELKALGVSIVMDDFGTGYSSLSYLWKFPFDKIKIDRSFMKSFGETGGDVAAVVRSIISLARELSMRVTVEGVETLSQADFLYEADADQVQGFYFGRPMPATDVAENTLASFRRSLPAPSETDKDKIKLVKP